MTRGPKSQFRFPDVYERLRKIGAHFTVPLNMLYAVVTLLSGKRSVWQIMFSVCVLRLICI